MTSFDLNQLFKALVPEHSPFRRSWGEDLADEFSPSWWWPGPWQADDCLGAISGSRRRGQRMPGGTVDPARALGKDSDRPYLGGPGGLQPALDDFLGTGSKMHSPCGPGAPRESGTPATLPAGHAARKTMNAHWLLLPVAASPGGEAQY